MSSLRILSRNTVIATCLATSCIAKETVVNLLLGDSSIGQSEILVLGGKGLEGSIVDVDSTATTYEVNCATTISVAFPFTTPDCVGGENVTITQGSSTAFLTQVYTTESTSKNFREGCTFSNSDTVTCSLTNTISESFVTDGSTSTTSYTETSSGVNASPSNGPLYFSVTITAGLEKLSSFQAASTSSSSNAGTSSSSTISTTPVSTTSNTPSGASKSTMKEKLRFLAGVMLLVCFGL